MVVSDIVFFIVHAAIFLVTVLMGSPDHALAVKLLLTHLVKPILLVMAVSHDACDLLSRCQIFLLLTIWAHCILILV